MSRHVSSAPPKWIEGYEPRPFTVETGPLLLTDWLALGCNWTIIIPVLFSDVGELVGTTEVSFDGEHVELALAPKPFTVPAGYSWGDTYGIDEPRPFWRLWVSGTGSGRWGVWGIPR